MDTLTPLAFNEMWERVALYVDMKGAYNTEEIDRRMDKARKRNKERLKQTESKAEKHRLKRAIKLNRQAVEYGFARVAIDRANANPRGFIANTIRFGLSTAMKIRNERRRLKLKKSKWSIRRR